MLIQRKDTKDEVSCSRYGHTVREEGSVRGEQAHKTHTVSGRGTREQAGTAEEDVHVFHAPVKRVLREGGGGGHPKVHRRVDLGEFPPDRFSEPPGHGVSIHRPSTDPPTDREGDARHATIHPVNHPKRETRCPSNHARALDPEVSADPPEPVRRRQHAFG